MSIQTTDYLRQQNMVCNSLLDSNITLDLMNLSAYSQNIRHGFLQVGEIKIFSGNVKALGFSVLA